MREETIAAIATAYGEGGIGVIRISGEEALPITEKIFAPKLRPSVMTYGHVRDNFTGELIDEVLAVYFRGPKSYTAEDVVEIQCHGSVVALRKILSLVLRNGARMAEPGEFTKRAFLNGRLDLSQAEAVIDLIRAKTDRTFDVALDQLEGKFSRKIKELRKGLVDVLVELTVNIDYPDEDIEEMTYEGLRRDLSGIAGEVETLLQTADTGRILQEGLRVSIIGKPNVGKSSLMNALLNETRAIVTSIPGTTRDTIEETLSLRSIPVVLTDTAGIRETEDVIEKIGIEKSKEAFNRSDLVIFMMDASSPMEEEDREIMEVIGDRRVIAVLNKTDLGQKIDRKNIMSILKNAETVEISLLLGTGIEELKDRIEDLVLGGKVTGKDSPVVTNVRHEGLLREALSSLGDALSMAERREPLELLEIDVNQAYESLGRIIGEAVEEDILSEVFRRFCLGK